MSTDLPRLGEQPGRAEVVGRKPAHALGQRDAEQRAGGRRNTLVDVGELVQQKRKNATAPMPTTPESETVESVDEVTALMVATTMKLAGSASPRRVEGYCVPSRPVT